MKDKLIMRCTICRKFSRTIVFLNDFKVSRCAFATVPAICNFISLSILSLLDHSFCGYFLFHQLFANTGFDSEKSFLKRMLSSILHSRSSAGSSLLRRHLPRIHSFATLATLEKAYPIGSQIHGFTVSETKTISELDLLAVHLKHDLTGAEYLHVARDDDNNVFSIAFKTNPPDATGVPHILEHTTLCGSEKYQVRDPFFKMLNRSLANFMNAMTGMSSLYD